MVFATPAENIKKHIVFTAQMCCPCFSPPFQLASDRKTNEHSGVPNCQEGWRSQTEGNMHRSQITSEPPVLIWMVSHRLFLQSWKPWVCIVFLCVLACAGNAGIFTKPGFLEICACVMWTRIWSQTRCNEVCVITQNAYVLQAKPVSSTRYIQHAHVLQHVNPQIYPSSWPHALILSKCGTQHLPPAPAGGLNGNDLPARKCWNAHLLKMIACDRELG